VITSLSRLWETKREISTVQATWITSHWTAFRRFRHQGKSWCIQPWEVDLRSIKYPNLKLDHYKPRKALAQSWIQQLKNTWNKWIKFKRREQNRQHRQDSQIWWVTSRIITWISMQWLIVLLLIHWSIRITNRTSEALKVNLPLKEWMECKYPNVH